MTQKSLCRKTGGRYNSKSSLRI